MTCKMTSGAKKYRKITKPENCKTAKMYFFFFTQVSSKLWLFDDGFCKITKR